MRYSNSRSQTFQVDVPRAAKNVKKALDRNDPSMQLILSFVVSGYILYHEVIVCLL